LPIWRLKRLVFWSFLEPIEQLISCLIILTARFSPYRCLAGDQSCSSMELTPRQRLLHRQQEMRFVRQE
jgi:hypothetical protein